MQEAYTPTNAATIDRLNDLIALEFDAIAAYEAAVERLDTAHYKQRMREFMDDHHRHLQELTQAVEMLGGDPRERGDFKKILTKGKVVLAGLAGDDKILGAMKSNEDETNDKYEHAVRECSPTVAPQISDMLSRALADERRHRDWIVATLQGH